MENIDKTFNYLRSWLEANECDRLSPEEEQELPKRIQAGEKLKKQLKAEKREATPFEQAILNDSHEAFQKIVESNIPLGIHFAKKFAKSYPNIGLTVDDLTQEANIGIMHAAKLYDPNRDCKFSTYAAYWISQAIRRAIEDKGDLIRKPASAHSRARKVHQVDLKYKMHLDAQSMADLTGLSKEEVEFIRQLDQQQVTSIDQNFFSDDEDEQSFHETIADDTNVLDETVGGLNKKKLKKIIEANTDPESRAYQKMYYGFTSNNASLSAFQISLMTDGKRKESDIIRIIREKEQEIIIHKHGIELSDSDLD